MAISDFVKSLTKSSLLAHLKNVDTKTMKWRKDLLDAVVTKDELEDWSGGGGIDHGELGGLTDDDHTQYLLAAGTRALTGDWDAGSYEIRAKTLESDVAAGTAPLTVASNTIVTNLNADLLDSQEGSYYLDSDNFTGTEWTDLTDGGATTLHSHAGGGASDPDAIHDNVANEINAIAAKSDPVGADVLIIEDSEDTWNKKKITFSEFSIADHNHDSDYISILDDAIAGNFASLTHGGEISDSGYDASDFALYSHDHVNYVLRSQWKQNGFVSKDDITITWSDANRKLSVAKTGSNFTYFEAGVLYTKVGTQEVVIDDTEGLWVIYFDGETLTADNSPSDTDIEHIIENHTIVAWVYWDATNNLGKLFAEPHGSSMAPMTHHYLHDVFGSQYDSGMALGDILADEDGSSATHAQFSTGSGFFYDEDVKHATEGTAANVGLEIYYFDGSDLRWTTNAGYSFINGGSGRIMYNNSGAQTEVDNTKFVLAHVFATNIKDADGTDGRLIAIQGQAQYATLALARNGANTEINNLITGDLPLAEILPVATVIFQTANSYTNAVNARIRLTDTGDDYVDWRTSLRSGGGTSTTNDHGLLAGLADDDHTQYLLAAGTRGLSGDWDAGTFEIRANTFESDVATGTPPFTVASTSTVTNLDADTVDGFHATGFVPTPVVLPTSGNMVIWSSDAKVTEDSDVTNENILTYSGSIKEGSFPVFKETLLSPPSYILEDSGKSAADFATSDHAHADYINKNGTVALTANWDAGSYEIRAETLESDVATGTAPLTIASTTKVTNLNADLLDGYHSTTFLTAVNPVVTLTIYNGSPGSFAAGDLLYISGASGGNPSCAKADADGESTCSTMLVVANAAIASTATGSAIAWGYVSGLSSLTAGAIYYASTTAGSITTTAPSGSSDIVRIIGYALSTTELFFNPDPTYIEIV
jgi:hypothetical protein